MYVSTKNTGRRLKSDKDTSKKSYKDRKPVKVIYNKVEPVRLLFPSAENKSVLKKQNKKQHFQKLNYSADRNTT